MARADIVLEDIEAAFARIRPLILGHGGDVDIEDIDEAGVVTVRLIGACRACPNMAMTYVGPIRSQLMQVTGVTGVVCPQVRAAPRALERIARLSGARPFTEGA